MTIDLDFSPANQTGWEWTVFAICLLCLLIVLLWTLPQAWLDDRARARRGLNGLRKLETRQVLRYAFERLIGLGAFVAGAVVLLGTPQGVRTQISFSQAAFGLLLALCSLLLISSVVLDALDRLRRSRYLDGYVESEKGNNNDTATNNPTD